MSLKRSGCLLSILVVSFAVPVFAQARPVLAQLPAADGIAAPEAVSGVLESTAGTRAPQIDYSYLINREKTNPPLVGVVHGVYANEIGCVLEFKHIKWLFSLITGGSKAIKPGVTVQSVTDMIRWQAESTAIIGSRTDNDYVVTMLSRVKGLTGSNAELVKIEWSRDPGDSYGTVIRFKSDLLALQQRAIAENRPFYLIAFSWGSVLLYESLCDLHEEGRPIYVDRFVSMGSPLIPSGFIARVFVTIEIVKEQLALYVRKPNNVGVWTNLYSEYDDFCGPIKAADANIATHFPAMPVVQQLEDAQGWANYLTVRRDLSNMRSTLMWHMSYFLNISVPVETFGYTYTQDLITPYAKVYLPK